MARRPPLTRVRLPTFTSLTGSLALATATPHKLSVPSVMILCTLHVVWTDGNCRLRAGVRGLGNVPISDPARGARPACCWVYRIGHECHTRWEGTLLSQFCFMLMGALW
jgi:hypothetical protein